MQTLIDVIELFYKATIKGVLPIISRASKSTLLHKSNKRISLKFLFAAQCKAVDFAYLKNFNLILKPSQNHELNIYLF